MASIRQRPDGKWRARYIGPDGKERSQHFSSKVDGEAWLAMQVTRLRDGSWVDPRLGKRTFGEYAQQWLEGQIHHRSSTSSITRQRLDKHLIPHFGEVPLAAIQRSDVQAWVTSKSRDGLAASTVEGLYRLLAQVMLSAVEDRVLGHSPCRKIRLPQRDVEPLLVPTTEQIAAVYGAAPEKAKTLILVGAATGMRVSEIAGLTVDRVDWLRRTVTVDRQLVGVSGGVPRFGPPKTKASNRVLPLPESVVEAMTAHLVRWPSPDVVFRTAHDRPWTRKTLTEEWRRWRGTETFTWHALRHHYASALIAAGQSVKVVQDRLGHSTAAMTLDVYGHMFSSDEDGTRTVLEGVAEKISRTTDGPLARKSRSGA